MDNAHTGDSAVSIRVFDLREHATWGMEPGFYWSVSVDENGDEIPEGEERDLVGPFDTQDAAVEDGRTFIQDCLGDAVELLQAA